MESFTAITKKNNNNNNNRSSSSSSSGSVAFFKYPIQGIIYLISSQAMRKLFLGNMLLTFVITIMIMKLLFGHTYQHQLELIASSTEQFEEDGGNDDNDDGDLNIYWYTHIQASIAVLFEASIITMRLLKCCCIGRTQKKIFVTTMKEMKTWNEDTMIEPSPCSSLCSVPECTNNCRKLNSTLLAILTFPLHVMFPVLGTIVYAYINAHYTAWDYMDLYFDAISLSSYQAKITILGTEEQNHYYIKSLYHRYNILSNGYIQFGFVVSLLEILPIFGPSLFALSNACGTALWATTIEQHGGLPIVVQQQQQQNHQQQQNTPYTLA